MFLFSSLTRGTIFYLIVGLCPGKSSRYFELIYG